MNLEDMTQEQVEDMEAQYLAEGIDVLEKETGLELGEEAIDDVINRARANRGENLEPLVADAFSEVVSQVEAEGGIDYSEQEQLEQFEAPAEESFSAEEFAAMQRGDYGAEIQRQALEFAGVGTEEPAGEEWGNDWAMEFLAQQEQLEKKLGRELTGPEAKALEDDAAGTDKPLDLLGRYDDVVGRDPRRSEDRHDVMVEAFEDNQSQGNGDGSYTEDWEPEEEPKAPDLTNDEDRQAAMAAAMEEAEA